MLLSIEDEAALIRAVHLATDAGGAVLGRTNKLGLQETEFSKVGVVGVEVGVEGTFGDIETRLSAGKLGFNVGQ